MPVPRFFNSQPSTLIHSAALTGFGNARDNHRTENIFQTGAGRHLDSSDRGVIIDTMQLLQKAIIYETHR
ncbi:MAG: hypothetical protein ABSB84_11720 [Verrucomicrobiota bacterium]|jgi:hypothetical protein